MSTHRYTSLDFVLVHILNSSANISAVIRHWFILFDMIIYGIRLTMLINVVELDTLFQFVVKFHRKIIDCVLKANIFDSTLKSRTTEKFLVDNELGWHSF